MGNQHNKQLDTIPDDCDPVIEIQDEQSGVKNRTPDPVQDLIESNSNWTRDIIVYEHSFKPANYLEVSFMESPEQQNFTNYQETKSIIFNHYGEWLRAAYRQALQQKVEEIQQWEKQFRINVIQDLHRIKEAQIYPANPEWNSILETATFTFNTYKIKRAADIQDIYKKIEGIFGIKK